MTRPKVFVAKAGEKQFDHAVGIISHICNVSASRTYCADTTRVFNRRGLRQAVLHHNTAALFDWIMEMVSFQGISDSVAETYLQQHGSISWADIQRDLERRPPCPLLATYWTFYRCGYDKTSRTCHEPDHIDLCPLPKPPLRNGRLNQSAFSLFLFIRDVAGGDLVGWLDGQIAGAGPSPEQAIENVITPLRHVFGVSDKILAMSLSTLLIGAKAVKPRWFEVGSHMIVVDTLVHNFLHRSGMLARFDVDHTYGLSCYQPGSCADILRQVSASIDCRQYNPVNPEYFPRLVQHSVWNYCAASGLNVCNGNTIDDLQPCRNWRCACYAMCDHITLNRYKSGFISTT